MLVSAAGLEPTLSESNLGRSSRVVPDDFTDN